jgi:protein SCO1/2
MNRHAMIKAIISTFAALVLLSACDGSTTESQGQPPLAGAAIGGPFELVNAKGETVRWSDFDGKYRMIYFGYAYCPDVCPFDVQRMMRGYEKVKADDPELAAQIVPIFVTIDPERDTPQVVGEFASAFSDDLIGLTGTPEQVGQAAKSFAVYYAKGKANEAGGYLMDHSRSAYLMDREGKPLALLPVEQSGDAVAAEVEKWAS